jgi:hypothetical protein
MSTLTRKQSSGPVKLYSEVGIGMSVKLYLPRLHAEFDVVDEAATVSEGR